MTDNITLEGTCQRIIYQNSDNGYCVFKITQADQFDLVCVGTSPNLSVGQLVRLTGQYHQDPKYGKQLRCESIIPILPKDTKSMIKYLCSGTIPGIGEGFAKKLVDFAGTELFTVLDNEPEKLYTIKGIGEKRIQGLLRHWQEHRATHEILLFLQRFGVGPKRAMHIYQRYHDQSIHILKTNPYQIYQDIVGIGFKIADQIAMAGTITPEAPERLSAAAYYLLEQGSQSGHCFLPIKELTSQLFKLLCLDPSDIKADIDDIIHQHTEITRVDERIYLSKLYRAETNLAQQITHIYTHHSVWEKLPHHKYNEWIEQNQQPLSPSQQQALQAILNTKIGIITGGPGVGKTTLIKTILYLAKKASMITLLCAPTGRAAKKLSSSTNQSAKTIHRLLKVDPSSKKFQHHADNPLKADLIVIDEASMIDVYLANSLMQAIDPTTNVILVGDIDQLPSVGPGTFLKDMIKAFPGSTAHLSEIFRQAQDSKIIQNAHLVNQGKMLTPNDTSCLSDFYCLAESEPEMIVEKIKHLMTSRIPHSFKMDPIDDIQILSPMHKGILGTHNLNEQLQQLLNDSPIEKSIKFRVKDKVIQLKNNYDKDVFNGDIGYIKQISSERKELSVDFGHTICQYLYSELDELQLAYAISIHKSQGSEYPAVIIPLAMQHYTLLERNLLYTAITRGKQLVILIGQMKAIAMAIKNQKSHHRFTRLMQYIEEIQL